MELPMVSRILLRGNYVNALETWQSVANRLKILKAKELELRKELCEAILDGAHGEVRKVQKFPGGIVTVQSKLTRAIDEAALYQLWPSLSEPEKACFRIKKSLILKQYRALDSDSEVHSAITEKPATPTLSVKWDNDSGVNF